MTQILKLQLILGILCILCVTGCASTSQTLSPAGVERIRPWNFDAVHHSDTPRTVFVSKGIYLTGLPNDSSYAPGTWVRLIPGDAWLENEPRPTLIMARVAERAKTSARLEMLAYQSGFRDTNLAFEPYRSEANSVHPAQMMHAMTKRLTFAAGDIQPNASSVHVPLTQLELMQGTEIYGAFDIGNGTSRERLASQNRALMTVEAIGDTLTQLKTAAGSLPEMPVFVLLDAPQMPAFQIDIQISELSGDRDEHIVNQIQKTLNSGVPGSEYLQIHKVPAKTADETWAALGQTCTDKLEIHLIQQDDNWRMLDQGFRVLPYPWRVVLQNSDTELAAAAVLSSAYQMLGYSVSAAWILEQNWKNTQILENRAALAPALALAYHEMERDDWALELALELQGYAQKASKTAKSVLLTAAASVYAIIGRLEEFEPNFEHIKPAHLPVSWLRILAYVQLSELELARMKEQFAVTHTRLVRENAWTEQDEMFSCAARIHEDEEACSQGVSMASTPFSQTWFETHESMHDASVETLLELAEAVDRLGAPELATQIWLELLQSSLSPETAFSVWQNAAAYARKSQQTRQWLHLMANLVRFLEVHPLPVQPGTFAEAVNGWRALDYRAELAALCRLRASGAAAQEARELRQFAVELYISMGDHENATAVMAELKTIP